MSNCYGFASATWPRSHTAGGYPRKIRNLGPYLLTVAGKGEAAR